MASLPADATIDDLYEELSFLEVCENTLDVEADDYQERLAKIHADREECERRLNNLQSATSTQQIPTSNSDNESSSTASSGPSFPRNLAVKRRNESDHDSVDRPSKRSTPEPSNAIASSLTPRTGLRPGDDYEKIARTAQARARMRQQAAEEDARKRREAQISDEQLARSLSNPGPQSFATPHSLDRPATQTVLQHNGSLQRPRPIVSTNQHLSPTPRAGPSSLPMRESSRPLQYPQSSSNGVKVENRPPQSSIIRPSQSRWPMVVDLTASDGEDDLQTVYGSRPISNRVTYPVLHPQQPQFGGPGMPGSWPRDPDCYPVGPTPQTQIDLTREHQPRHISSTAMLPPSFMPVGEIFPSMRSVNPQNPRIPGQWNGSHSYPHVLDDSDGFDDDDESDIEFLYRTEQAISQLGPYGQPRFGAYSGHEDLYRDRFDAIANYDPAKTKEEINALLNNIRPDEDMPAHLRVQTPVAMAIQLHKYQELGLTWLKNCETGTNKGGILADDMGLGKTIQMLSLIVTHKSEDLGCRATLIVAPVALMRQWKQEIEQKVKPGRHRLSVYVHHGPSKKSSFGDLAHYDVVLTTFGSVAAEVKKLEAFRLRRHNDPNARPRPKERCILIGEDAKWYRVILDEAQCIKNKNTKTAKGACLIQAKYRFCMTGTPMMNNVDELYSLIHFLRIKPYNSWERFRMELSQPLKNGSQRAKDQAMQKLQTVCKAVMLRRTKTSTFEGKPILVLSERTTVIDNPTFNEDEQSFYQALEQQTKLQFNKYFKGGTVGKQYSAILVLLLRLRQACCHPHLVRDFGVSAAADLTPDQMLELAAQLDPAVVGRIKERAGCFDCPICLDASTNPAIFIPCGHDSCADCFAKITDPSNGIAAGNENGSVGAKCPNCRGPIDSKRITDFESFKRVHQPELLSEEEREQLERLEGSSTEPGDNSDSESDSDTEDEDDDEVDVKDPTLGGFIVDDEEEEPVAENSADSDDEDDLNFPLKKEKQPMKQFGVKNEQIDDDDQALGSVCKITAEESSEVKNDMENEETKNENKDKGVNKMQASKGKGKKKGKARRTEKKDKKKKKEKKAITLGELKSRASRSVADKKRYLRRLREDWVSSAKIDKTLEILSEIMADPAGEKVLVFSQWTSFLDLLEVPIDGNGWGYRRYDGSMNARARSDAIDDFRDARNTNLRIMLVSLKAGNAGLNLNMASQVIILDPFWNPFIEEQAIDRAHRLGQTRPVQVHRVLVANTVEDRICKLQEEKRELISRALDEQAGQNISRLGTRELLYLFGFSDRT